MKNQTQFIILLLLAASCNPSRLIITSKPIYTDTKIVTITKQDTETPQIRYIPTYTITNTLVTPTPLIFQATVFSKFPKLITPLSAEDTKTLLYEMNTLQGCDIPCWWKIQLGTTTWDEVKILINYLGLSFGYEDYTYESGKFISWYKISPYIQNDYIKSEIDFYEDNHQIYYIRMYAEFPDSIKWSGRERSSYELRTKWKLLAPEKIIALFGDPTRVYYISQGPIGNEGSYSVPYHQLFIFYDEYGLAIEYSGWHKNEINNRCIGFTSTTNYPDSIRIFLKSLSVDTPIEEMHNISFWDGFPTLKESTGMEISEFTSKLTNPANNGCIF
jgi:hypothetical protein